LSKSTENGFGAVSRAVLVHGRSSKLPQSDLYRRARRVLSQWISGQEIRQGAISLVPPFAIKPRRMGHPPCGCASPLLLPPGVGPPFRPDQKVKLDKSEATRGGSFLGCSPRGMTSVMLPAASRPTLAKNARMGHPRFVMEKEDRPRRRVGHAI
jgi:hypothetical protein